jgi:hypothetical protein
MLDQLAREDASYPGDQTEAARLGAEGFPRARIVYRKFAYRHPADWDGQARPLPQRLLQLILFRPDQHDQLPDSGSL